VSFSVDDVTNCTNQAVLTVLEVHRYFAERIVNVWNFLPSSVNFFTLNAFKRSIVPIDFSLFLKCVAASFICTFLGQLSCVLAVPLNLL